jgi:hypothetical protein
VTDSGATLRVQTNGRTPNEQRNGANRRCCEEEVPIHGPSFLFGRRATEDLGHTVDGCTFLWIKKNWTEISNYLPDRPLPGLTGAFGVEGLRG